MECLTFRLDNLPALSTELLHARQVANILLEHAELVSGESRMDNVQWSASD